MGGGDDVLYCTLMIGQGRKQIKSVMGFQRSCGVMWKSLAFLISNIPIQCSYHRIYCEYYT